MMIPNLQEMLDQFDADPAASAAAPTMVTLRTGDRVNVHTLVPTTKTLAHLWAANREALRELIEAAWNPQHGIPADSANVLRRLALLTHLGVLHADVAAIVRASFDDDGNMIPAVAA